MCTDTPLLLAVIVLLHLKLGMETQVDIDGIDFSEIDAKYTALPVTKTVDGEDAEKLSEKGKKKKTTNAGPSFLLALPSSIAPTRYNTTLEVAQGALTWLCFFSCATA